MNYGRVSFSNADAVDRAIEQRSIVRPERRHQFRIRRSEPEAPKPGERVCPGCDLIRTPLEFRGFGQIERLCKSCRDKGRA
jgi:hypothetical protein